MKNDSTNSLANTKKFINTIAANPTEKNIQTQIAVHIEEFTEMLECLASPDNKEVHVLITYSLQYVTALQKALKESEPCLVVNDPVLMLDSLVDQIVTATGVGTFLGMDVIGGLDEVNRANFSKFDDSGNPIFDENMKAIKGPNYSPPQLDQFV